MSEELYQKISQFIDSEINVDEALDLVKNSHHEPHIHHKMQRYQFISHALKKQDFIQVRKDFSARIAQAIHDYEESQTTWRDYVKSPYCLSLAASIALISVVVLKVKEDNMPRQIVENASLEKTLQASRQLQYSNQYAMNRQNQYVLLHHNDVAESRHINALNY